MAENQALVHHYKGLLAIRIKPLRIPAVQQPPMTAGILTSRHEISTPPRHWKGLCARTPPTPSANANQLDIQRAGPIIRPPVACQSTAPGLHEVLTGIWETGTPSPFFIYKVQRYGSRTAASVSTWPSRPRPCPPSRANRPSSRSSRPQEQAPW